MKLPLTITSLIISIILIGCAARNQTGGPRLRKSDIVDLTFSYDTTAALETAQSVKIGITAIRRDGKLKHSKGLLEGWESWRKYGTIITGGTISSRGVLTIERNVLSQHNNTISIKIFHTKSPTITKTFTLQIPKVTGVRLSKTTKTAVTPKTLIPLEIGVAFSNGVYKTTTNLHNPLMEHVQLQSYNATFRERGAVPKILLDSISRDITIRASGRYNEDAFTKLTLPLSYKISERFAFNGNSGWKGTDGSNASGTNGIDGRDGDDGERGGYGRDGKNSKLYIQSYVCNDDTLLRVAAQSGVKVLYSSIIDVKGGKLLLQSNGGQGGTGGDGGNGSSGADKTDSNSAGKGGKGGNGGDGGRGGDGGNVTIYLDSIANGYRELIYVESFGGAGGEGGDSGHNGGDGAKPIKGFWGAVGGLLNIFGSGSGYNGSTGKSGRDGREPKFIISSDKVLTTKLGEIASDCPILEKPDEEPTPVHSTL